MYICKCKYTSIILIGQNLFTNMAKVYEYIANGSEEIEALTVVDVLRRAGVEVVTVSINETEEVTMSHGVRMTCDTTIAKVDVSDADMLLIPGGLPGATNLNDCTGASGCEPMPTSKVLKADIIRSIS